MPSISIQFHALPNELATFVQQFVSEMGLYAVAITFPPFAARQAAAADVTSLIVEGPCLRLVFTERPPYLPIVSETEFWEKNPGSLDLLIGRMTPKGLKQSALGCGTAAPPISPTWKKIARKLRAATKAGTISINPDTGATGRVKSFRYTLGAKALSDQGVPILPLGGGTLMKLGLPEGE
jgi:hypothetical protein